MKMSLFSIDLWHVYWPVSQKVFWRLTAGFVGMGHICSASFMMTPLCVLNYSTHRNKPGLTQIFPGINLD